MPGWDETDTSFRHRLKDPGDFIRGTFRTVTIQEKKPKVLSVMGKLRKGDGSMTMQSIIFPKSEGWTLSDAKQWVKSHDIKEQPAMRENKDFAFDLKSVDDEGVFTGILSVYNVVDLGNEMVEPGAFTKSLQDRGTTLPCLWQHCDPIGSIEITDTGTALEVKGKLVLDVQLAREALALMKAGVVRGLSIGYKTIRSKMEGGIRKLKELALYEGSIVTFPMLPLAQITSVKSETKDTFQEALERAQSVASRSMMMNAIYASLDSIAFDDQMEKSEKVTQSSESIDQFKSAYLAALPSFLSVVFGEPTEDEDMDEKAGRMLSSANQRIIEQAIGILQALLDANSATTSVPETDAGAVEKSSEPASSNHPAPDSAPPEHHPEMEQLIPLMKGRYTWIPKN